MFAPPEVITSLARSFDLHVALRLGQVSGVEPAAGEGLLGGIGFLGCAFMVMLPRDTMSPGLARRPARGCRLAGRAMSQRRPIGGPAGAELVTGRCRLLASAGLRGGGRDMKRRTIASAATIVLCLGVTML